MVLSVYFTHHVSDEPAGDLCKKVSGCAPNEHVYFRPQLSVDFVMNLDAEC